MLHNKKQLINLVNWLVIGLIVVLWLKFSLLDDVGNSLDDSGVGIKPISAAQHNPANDAVEQYHIFGSAQELYEIPLSQGQTSLDFVLNGTMSHADGKNGFAYISNGQGIQKKFNIDDKIFNLATLKEIHKTHVMILHNGKKEKLSLSEKASMVSLSNRNKAVAKPVSKNAQFLNGSQQRNWQEMMDQQKFDPNKISSIVGNVNLVTNQAGQIQGLRVSNLADGNLLKKHGLKSNDIITAINGNKVSSKNMMTIKQTLQQSPNATVTIKRNGKVQNVQINLQDL